MSQRKQASIDAARQIDALEMSTPRSSRHWRAKLRSPKLIAAFCIGLLAALAAVGATVSHFSGNSTTGQSLSPASFASTGSPLAANPMPSPSPALRLSKEILYAGGKMLAVEDAGATGSQQQPADLVVWRLSTGYWYVRDSTDGTWIGNAFGAGTDKAAPGDFDGDGFSDFSVYRPNTPSAGLATWYIQPNSQAGSGNFYGVQFGLNSDVPVPADYDGDGKSDIAVWRSSTAQFIILKSSTNAAQSVTVGQSSDAPVAADYDGDGRADPAIYRSSNFNWIINQSSNNQLNTQVFGQSGDVAVTGDYDGDGKFDLAVRRNSSNQWLYRPVTGGTPPPLIFTSFTMQTADITVAGDYDGDGKTDLAVWRPATGYWYIQKSSTNTLRSDQWGTSGDTPIAAPMKR